MDVSSRHDFKLKRVHAFLAVFHHGSTLAASQVVHLSQPAVAAAVAALESDLGERLFTRTSRGMTPTTGGERFAERARAALFHLKQAEGLIRLRLGQKPGLPAGLFSRNVSEVHLRTLTAVVETGGFSSAARRLAISQPSVHRAARELEALCCFELWRRVGVGVEPVEDAYELARLSRLCFRELEAGFEDIRERRGQRDGSLNVGALPLARSKWLPDALAATLARFPDARVRVMDGPYDEQLAALRHARIDIILGALREPAPMRDVDQHALFRDPWLIVVRPGHPFAPGFDSDSDKLTPAQLGNLPWILPRQGTPGREAFERFLANKGLPPAPRVVECASLVTTRALVLQTDYAALVSRQQVESDVREGRLKIMGPPLTGSYRNIGITTRSGFTPTGLQQTFLDAVQACVGDNGPTT